MLTAEDHYKQMVDELERDIKYVERKALEKAGLLNAPESIKKERIRFIASSYLVRNEYKATQKIISFLEKELKRAKEKTTWKDWSSGLIKRLDKLK